MQLVLTNNSMRERGAKKKQRNECVGWYVGDLERRERKGYVLFIYNVGESPLMVAALYGRQRVAEDLLEYVPPTRFHYTYPILSLFSPLHFLIMRVLYYSIRFLP